MCLVIAPEYRQAGSYLFARLISPDKRACVYRHSFTWTKSRLFVEVPNCLRITQERVAFQLIWISLERTADCEICCKRGN